MTDEFDHLEDEEENEAYCVRCRHKVTMVSPEAVWTAKGTPGTRGLCPDCGTVVFRMGKTAAHDSLIRPAAVRVEGGTKTVMAGGRKRAQPATYINYASPDAEFASRLATDLENAGIHTWIDTNQSGSTDIKWAGGVHPALKDSAQMVVVLSSAGKDSEQLTRAWTFFKSQKKRITVALLDPVEPPDPLRRSPRFDFSQDYKTAFRQLLSALSE